MLLSFCFTQLDIFAYFIYNHSGQTECRMSTIDIIDAIQSSLYSHAISDRWIVVARSDFQSCWN